MRWLPLLLLGCACGAPTTPGPTGGTEQKAGACGRGFVVVNVDETDPVAFRKVQVQVFKQG